MGDKPMKKSKYLALKSNSKGSKVVQIFESEEEILARGSEDGFDDEQIFVTNIDPQLQMVQATEYEDSYI
jgi:hypothetical protein